MTGTEHPAATKRVRSIVYVNNFAGVGLGGGEKHLLALAKAARDAGFDATIVCLPGSGIAGEARSQGLSVVEMDLMGRNVPLTVFRLARCFRGVGAGIVHTAGFYVNSLGRVAARLAGVKAVLSTVHCEPDSPVAFDDSTRARLAQKLRVVSDNFTSRFASLILADSEAIARKLIEQGVRQSKVRVVHNAVSFDEIREEISSAELGLDLPEGRLVGTVGRLEPVKGLEDLIGAARILCERRQDVRFLIVGDGPLRAELEEKVREAGLEDRVLVTGYVPSALAVMTRLDVYVLSSLSEGFNTTLLEALALRRPVVATNAGGNGEIIRDGQTGLLVAGHDPEALARAIRWMLDHPEPAAQLAAAGQRRVAGSFSLERMCEATVALYEGLLSSMAASSTEGYGEDK